MSGKTIRLLQIVYGADLKKLQMSADKLANDINNLDLNRNLRNKGDQSKFVGDMGDVTAKALKMANQLNARATDPNISPWSQDMLRKAAQNLKDKAQEVIDAGNAALRDPTLMPKVQAALDNLKKGIMEAKAIATQVAPEDPALDNLRKLMPLIENAENKAAALPQALKTPGKYERAEKEVKDAVQELTKALKPNPKLKRDAEKIDEALAEQILAARKNLKHPGDPQQNKEVDNATQKLLDALANLKKHNPQGQISPEDKNELLKALENLKKTFSPDLLKKPEDKEQEAFERLKDLLDGMKKATREEDPQALAPLLKQAVGAAKDLASKMKDPENLAQLPPYRRPEKEQGANDILEQLPKLVKNAAAFRNTPKDEDASESLMDAIRKLQKVADRPNRPRDEKEIRDNLADALSALKKAQGAARNGSPKETDDALNDLARALANLRKAGDRMKEKSPNPGEIEKPLSELEKLFEKFKKTAPEAALGNPNAMKETNAAVPLIEQAMSDLGRVTKATDIAPIMDVEDAIDDVVIAAGAEDQGRVAPAFKDLVKKLNELGDHVETLPDPQARKIGKNAVEEIKPGLKELLQKVKEYQAHPEKPGLFDELNDVANRLKAPLADLKKAVEPKSFDRSPEAAGAAVKKALENLRKAMNSGDPEAVRRALDDLRDALGKYNDVADSTIKQIQDPKKKQMLEGDVDELKELLGDLRRVDPTKPKDIKNLLDQIPDRLDDWRDTLHHTAKDDAIKAIAKTTNLVASLTGIDDDDMDLGDLLTTAGDLSGLLRGLITDSTGLARKMGTNPENLTDAAKAAIDLDKFLRRLEGEEEEVVTLPAPAVKEEPVKMEVLFVPHSDELFEQISLDKAKTFDEVLAAVANEMHQAAKNLSEEADHLAKELAFLARAARSGNRQDLLMAARQASAFIIAFCKQLDILAKKIPGRNMAERKEQDNLYRYQQALKNYGTQLKILSSVKAASIEDSKDTDASLTTLTRNLGDVVGASLHSMAVTRDAIFGGKVPK
eukprot:TRINITY_DN2182_c0_g1_i1.p1 TRINITY_DN2182_c0_g1~~TRINITY_DN2182_c0_g1_i1.p1  ORF type:complete len:1140 (+),score=347.38 TRINITY_DN2182_c0_g1_i1:380-3421(+)